MWTIFKVFIEFCYNIASVFYGLWCFGHEACEISAPSPIMNRTHIFSIGKWSLNHWTNQGSPYFVFFKFHLYNNSLWLSFPRWLVSDALGGKRLLSLHTEFEKCRCLWWVVNGDFKYSFGSHLGRNSHREKIILANNRQSAKAVISAV